MILQNLFEESKIFHRNQLVETPYFKDTLEKLAFSTQRT